MNAHNARGVWVTNGIRYEYRCTAVTCRAGVRRASLTKFPDVAHSNKRDDNVDAACAERARTLSSGLSNFRECEIAEGALLLR